MRLIKFREWETERKTMSYSNREDFDDMVGFRFDHEEGGKRILMQYTGLTDKNGKEIYEGDIIEFFHEDNTADTSERSEIVYYGDSGYPAFDFNGLRIKKHHFMEVNALSELVQSGNYYYKIIGNIHEDKHLLEVKS